jgi:hypothetical protein
MPRRKNNATPNLLKNDLLGIQFPFTSTSRVWLVPSSEARPMTDRIFIIIIIVILSGTALCPAAVNDGDRVLVDFASPNKALSVDQLVANSIGTKTRWPSLQLSTEAGAGAQPNLVLQRPRPSAALDELPAGGIQSAVRAEYGQRPCGGTRALPAAAKSARQCHAPIESIGAATGKIRPRASGRIPCVHS